MTEIHGIKEKGDVFAMSKEESSKGITLVILIRTGSSQESNHIVYPTNIYTF